ncbi:transmembrane protein 70 homolog, mitochondrial-like [Pollicipes pollicipes]|uniref:transmembrane protein 70 homolog, mitochondrial-like n=1 Tax=Pollicipes pollicipes TaxID=41117 RepID=UPI001885A037|nr:transmembrane protein 70 homolog, mitochondrial-like [Pollicipes pollicipes]XP_037085066.1 transmembrane protein 70 homolog, mitochondrial-like [Pollicipes pollicipes]XP_037085067.1 transmembrane protein 70 homolog, mitochondrial-like [Pollicipes pollicipes]
MFSLFKCIRLVRTDLSLLKHSARFLPSSCVCPDRFKVAHTAGQQRCLATTGRWLSAESTDDKPKPLVVYQGPLAGQMKRLKVFSLFTSAVGIYVAPTVMTEMSKAGMGIAIMMGSVMGTFTLLTPLLIHMVVRNYVVRLEHDEATDQYTATTISLMLRKRTLTFGVDDVTVPAVPGMFTTFLARGRPLFVDAGQFEPIEHYGRLMGYDRPFDFKLHKQPPSSSQPPKT